MPVLSHYLDVCCGAPLNESPGDVAAAMSRAGIALHIVGVELGSPLPIAFPVMSEERAWIGDVIRVFGTEEALRSVRTHRRMRDEVATDALFMQAIQRVPDDAGHACYARDRRDVLTLAGLERTERRLRKRMAEGKSSLDEAALLRRRVEFAAKAGRTPSAPHLTFRSLSSQTEIGTGGRFKLFVSRSKADAPQPGQFSTYGLGLGGATVPEF
jgi:CRISPR-associated endoribonuclease Cas6/Csy4 subtype I-F